VKPGGRELVEAVSFQVPVLHFQRSRFFMDIGLREWLIIIGIIVIAGILFDGWRRMRGGKGTLKFKLDRRLAESLPDDDEDDTLGPVRVVRAAEPSLGEMPRPAVKTAAAASARPARPQSEPVPTLLSPL